MAETYDFVLASDFHADLYRGDADMIQDAADLLYNIIFFCREHSVTVLGLLGDIFHNPGRVRVDAYNKLYNHFLLAKEWGINVYFVHGNHDLADRSERDSSLLSFMKIFNVQPISTNSHDLELNINGHKTLVFVHPFTRNRKMLAAAIEIWSDIKYDHKMVWMHEYIKGMVPAVVDSFPVSSLAKKRFDLIASGHYHDHVRMGNLLHTGSVRQLDWSDAGKERGCYACWFEPDGSITTEFRGLTTVAATFVTLEEGTLITDDCPFYAKVISNKPVDPDYIAYLKESGARSVTVSIEGGSGSNFNIPKVTAKDTLVEVVDSLGLSKPDREEVLDYSEYLLGRNISAT